MPQSEKLLKLEDLVQALDSQNVPYKINRLGERVYALYSNSHIEVDHRKLASGDEGETEIVLPPYIRLNASTGVLTLEEIPGQNHRGKLITRHDGYSTKKSRASNNCQLYDYLVTLSDSEVSIGLWDGSKEIGYRNALNLIAGRFREYADQPPCYSKAVFEKMKDVILDLKHTIDIIYGRAEEGSKRRGSTRRREGVNIGNDDCERAGNGCKSKAIVRWSQGTLFDFQPHIYR